MGFWDSTPTKKPEEQSGGFWGTQQSKAPLLKPKTSAEKIAQYQSEAPAYKKATQQATGFWGVAKNTIKGIPGKLGLTDIGKKDAPSFADHTVSNIYNLPGRIAETIAPQSDRKYIRETQLEPYKGLGKDTAKAFAQGIGRSYVATGQAIYSGSTSKPYMGAVGNDKFAKFNQALTGTDKPISARQEDKDFLGEKYGGYTAGGATVGLTALDLAGGGGVKGVVGLTRTLKAAKTAEEAAKALRAANFSEDIIKDYAPVFAKTTDTKEITKGIQSAQNLQNTTKTATAPLLKPVYKGETDLSTKILKDLEGRSTVSRQYLEDATNRPDIKQAERDLIRKTLADEGDTVSVPDFANKVKSELLPLTTNDKPTRKDVGRYASQENDYRYENVTLPDELRGPVANYKERIYSSPIATSAGEVHFPGQKDYFAHSRIEDLPDKGTRRVIEIQSDLFQKGRLEQETPVNIGNVVSPSKDQLLKYLDDKEAKELNRLYAKSKTTAAEDARWQELRDKAEEAYKSEKSGDVAPRMAELSKLEPYRNTWHERVIREEVKQAAKDGKTKLQFPTGETAMKIEGLGERSNWTTPRVVGDDGYVAARPQTLSPENLKVGEEVWQSADRNQAWIITDVLGDGKFKAVQKRVWDAMNAWKVVEDTTPAGRKVTLLKNPETGNTLTVGANETPEGLIKEMQEQAKVMDSETFDISGKVDTENPIYKFYEKTVRKYLTNKYGAKEVTDAQGVKWLEVDLKGKGFEKAPVEAFGAGAGVQQDEEGNVSFDPALAGLGLFGIAALRRGKGAVAKATPPGGFDTQKYVAEQVAKREGARTASRPGFWGNTTSFLKLAKKKMVDFSAPIEDVLYSATKKAGIKLKPSEDIHNQIDRVLRSPTLAGQFAKDNGIVQVIQKVDNADALDQYLIARHAIELDTRGITTGRNLADDTKLVAALGSKYEKEAKTIVDYSRKLLDYSVESGLINKELADTLKKRYPDYVPFNRIFDEVEKQGGVGNGRGVASLSRQTVVQKIIGSEREVESPLRSLLAKTNDAFKQGEKNKAAKLLAGYEKLPGNPFQLKEINAFVDEATGKILHTADDAAHDTISFLDNGVKRTFKTTPDVAQAAKAMNVQQLNILGKIFALPTRIARLGLTGINLPFIATNIVRDQITAFINTDRAMATSLANPANFLRALFSAVKHDDLYKEMVRAGGGGTSFDISRNQVEHTYESVRAGKSKLSKALYSVRHPSELLRAVEDIVGRAEELARVQQFRGTKKAMIKEGMEESEAIIGGARAARDTTVNFARRGEWGTVLNAALLYMNASIQGTRNFMRNIKQKPVATSAKIAVSTLFPVAVITAWNLSDSKRKAAYEDIPEWEKENNMIIVPSEPTQDERGRWNVIKIPLEQSTNDLTRLTRRPLEIAHGLDPIAFGDFYKTIVGTVSPIGSDPRGALSSVIPQAIKPVVEGMVNQNLFTGTPIVPMGMQNLSPEEQVKSYTSGTARKIGGALGVSPLKTEAFIKGTFGGLGPQVLNASDNALAATGVIPKEQIGGQSIPAGITARFSKASGGENESKAYATLDKAAQEKGDYKAKTIRPIYDQAQKLKAEGKLEEANALWAALSEKDKEIYKGIKSAEKTKATLELQRKLVPLYEKLQDMKAAGQKAEADAIYYALSPEEQHAYTLLKKKLQ